MGQLWLICGKNLDDWAEDCVRGISLDGIDETWSMTGMLNLVGTLDDLFVGKENSRATRAELEQLACATPLCFKKSIVWASTRISA